MFKDYAVIYVAAGKGGDGACAFRREKFVPRGGPSGGDGGRGGSIWLVASLHETTLYPMLKNPHIRAGGGENGMGGSCHGKNGEDVEVFVPIGTQIRDHDTKILLRDLKEEGDRVCVARGGNGGWGNERFKSPINQTPRQYNPGTPGEQRTLELELKLIADIGLVGFPNAGKSTLIGRVSAARPKVADYPFTTLQPHPGVVELSGNRRFVIVDIPGLIEGAADGQGLGHRFLRHVERTRALVHMVDMAPIDGSDPVVNHATILRELERYSAALAQKPSITVFTKADLVEDPDAKAAELAARLGLPAYAVSAVTGHNMDRLLEDAWRLIGR